MLLDNFLLQVGVAGCRKWKLSYEKVCNVCEVYHLLTEVEPVNHGEYQDITWKKIVPLKFFIFAWRLFLNRIATSNNFVRCGVIQPNQGACNSGSGIWCRNKMCLTFPFKSFDENKVLKIVNWI